MSNPKIRDIRDDGFVYNGSQWRSPKGYLKQKLSAIVLSAKRRAFEKNLPFDIDVDYLLSLYPKDNLCPVLGIELAFGNDNGRNNSPSIDRIIPALGYTKGNIIIVSLKANRIKQNATPEEIIKVGEFYQMMENSE